jgi:hypothetical protein
VIEPRLMNQPPTPAVVHEIAAPATAWDPYFSISALASHSTLSARLLRSFLTAPDHPLPHYRVGGRVLVKRSDFDAWIQIFRQPADSRDADVRSLMGLDGATESPHRHGRSTVTPRRV